MEKCSEVVASTPADFPIYVTVIVPAGGRYIRPKHVAEINEGTVFWRIVFVTIIKKQMSINKQNAVMIPKFQSLYTKLITNVFIDG
jgi:hypothetical protein